MIIDETGQLWFDLGGDDDRNIDRCRRCNCPSGDALHKALTKESEETGDEDKGS